MTDETTSCKAWMRPLARRSAAFRPLRRAAPLRARERRHLCEVKRPEGRAPLVKRRCLQLNRSGAALVLALAMGLCGSVRAEEKPVSYYRDLLPIFKRSCTGCHHPGKLKGELDLTTYEAFLKGGKHGAGFKSGDLKASMILEEISGAEPSMPKEGDPLRKDEVALVERWIQEGATNDTPANAHSFKLAGPPSYNILPVVSALAYSPDGK